MKSLRAIAQNIKVEAHTIWLCARDPDVAWPARLFALAVAAYALSPVDLIPDFIPVLGLVDEALLIPSAVWLFRLMVPRAMFDRHRATALAAAERPVSRAGMVTIIGLWLTGALLAGWWLLG